MYLLVQKSLDMLSSIVTVAYSTVVKYGQIRAAKDSTQHNTLAIISSVISNKVTVYGHQGWIEDLPNMNYRRIEHGCTSYLSKGKRVSMLFLPNSNP